MFEKIYLHLPRKIQNALLSFYGYKINKARYSAVFKQKLKEVCSNSFNSQNELKKYHNDKFLELLKSIKSDKDSLNRFIYLYGDIDKFSSIDDIKKIPLTTKNKIKDCLKKFPIVKKQKILVAHTSGTTGSGLIFPISRVADAYQWAIWWRYRFKHGISFDTVCGYFGGRSFVPVNESKCFYRINSSSNQVMLSAYHLNLKTLGNYVEGIKTNKVSWLHGYPSFLSHFASLCLQENIDFKNQIKIVTVGSESLLANQKEMIETAFNCKVRQHYGLAEGVVNISENENGDMIVDEDFSFCEFINIKGTDTFKIVGTSLFNSAIPFLRYDTGDIATLVKTDGVHRKVFDIDGRKEDYIKLKDDTKIGRLDHIFKDILEVKEVQIRQINFDLVEIHIVKGMNYSLNVEKKVISEFNKRLGGRIGINIIYRENIEKNKSGKLRFVVSDI